MSDSEEDWFNKDEDEIVKSIKKKDDKPPVEYIEAATNYEPMYDFSSSNVSSLSFKKLKLMAEMDFLEAFLEVGTTEFLRSFNVNTKIDSIILIVKIFGNLARLNRQLPDFISDCMHVFVEDECLNRNISNLTKKLFGPSHSKMWIESKIDIIDVTGDLILIFERAFEFGLQNDKLKKLIDHIVAVLASVKQIDKVADFKEKIFELQKRFKEPIEKRKAEDSDIFPTLEDLHTEKVTLLKPNIVNGKYASVEEYLSIQKNLLREDFIAPLRTAVLSMRGLQRPDEVQDVKMFENVKIVTNENLSVPKSDMLLVDVFAHAKDQCDDVTFSKQTEELKYLICGSLLCFSTTENFDNLILAVVSNSDAETMNQGYINIEIINQRNVGRIIGVTLQMMACPVFFEPYRHAFNVLNTYNEDNFPMTNYIVYTENQQKMPRYLSTDIPPKYTYQRSSFNPLLLETYPSSIKSDLTDTQLAAFQSALSNEFSLIQGPPGTGKTEISTRIAVTLLANTTLPIIIVAYTNDALDKFILKMLSHTDSVVRLGNQSKNEALNKYGVKEIFNTIKGDQRCKRLYYATKMEYSDKFSILQKLQVDFDGTEEEYQKIIAAQEDLNTVSRKLENLKMISTYLAVKDKRIIAMTTTCAAKHNLMLQFLKDSIVIFEEAAEVLESHILSSITKYTQQVILVGDHYQLRPHTSVYKSSREYKMNISLFERMVNNNINTVVLDTQFRMRPEIADLIRPLIYKDLQDGITVKSYNNIRGIKSNLFFVTHQHKENATNNLEMSKFNDFEKVWMCDVATYLLKHKYTHNDIVLLTTYLKQKDRLYSHIYRNCPHLQGIHISTVDNFQGREANIVLLSLVRSNWNNQIGYLKEQNRICVALSRAKMGLYIVGNMDLLAECSGTWDKIREKLNVLDAIGDKLPYTSNDGIFESPLA
ncbi:NFX1-type zinc finger-containing protein 1 [Episyrphus balteatus]|uniref:NFX1-type zinc finger-containing protein 1 n=1 Tax=Episyrphus balteatus TaxID=286459 RepID=UPI002485BAB3|nr:NFX1-type zinc finger-containing protein 1 [Episyrphus balteatus]